MKRILILILFTSAYLFSAQLDFAFLNLKNLPDNSFVKYKIEAERIEGKQSKQKDLGFLEIQVMTKSDQKETTKSTGNTLNANVLNDEDDQIFIRKYLVTVIDENKEQTKVLFESKDGGKSLKKAWIAEGDNNFSKPVTGSEITKMKLFEARSLKFSKDADFSFREISEGVTPRLGKLSSVTKFSAEESKTQKSDKANLVHETASKTDFNYYRSNDKLFPVLVKAEIATKAKQKAYHALNNKLEFPNMAKNFKQITRYTLVDFKQE